MEGQFSQIVAEAVRQMATRPSPALTAEVAVALCVEVIAGCDMAGVALHRPAGAEVVAGTTESLRRVAQWQHELGEGPCVDALRQYEMVSSGDLGADSRWPTFGRRMVAEIGIHSTVSFQLFTADETLGALNLYGCTVDAFGPREIAEGQAIAGHTAAAVAAATQREQFEEALGHRTVIGQATGILIERFGLDADTAFGVLRRLSQTGNVKLYSVAEQLVESGTLLYPKPRDRG